MFPGMTIEGRVDHGMIATGWDENGDSLAILTVEYPASYGDGLGDVIAPKTIETSVYGEGWSR